MAGEIWHAEHEAAKVEGCALCYPEAEGNGNTMEQHDCPACEAMRLAIVGYKAKTINELRRHLRLRHVPEQGGFPIGSMTKAQLIGNLVGEDFPNDDVNDAMHDFIKADSNGNR